MQTIHIDFFHDVLCAWCFALSPRVRRLVEENPSIDVDHHCFALAPSKQSLSTMFGDKAQAKQEILNHWRAANANDDEHRINTALMATRDYDYPYSMPGLIACKAAEMLAGSKGHWDYFDRVQKAHLTECRDITDREVLVSCSKDIGLDTVKFEALLDDPSTAKAVQDDIDLAEELGINSVPTLIINNKWLVSGAIHYGELKNAIKKVQEAK